MRFEEQKRFPKKALDRYAEILLRHVYQCGGRERYVPIAAIEDALGLEQELILNLCRTRLLGEVHVADRLHEELEDSVDCRTPFERRLMRLCFSEPHVRIRPGAVRLTEAELLKVERKRRKRKRIPREE